MSTFKEPQNGSNKQQRYGIPKGFPQFPDHLYETNAAEGTKRLSKDDIVRFTDAREQLVHERIIAAERIAVLQKKLSDCREREGVNSYENCRNISVNLLKRMGEFEVAFGHGTI